MVITVLSINISYIKIGWFPLRANHENIQWIFLNPMLGWEEKKMRGKKMRRKKFFLILFILIENERKENHFSLLG